MFASLHLWLAYITASPGCKPECSSWLIYINFWLHSHKGCYVQNKFLTRVTEWDLLFVGLNTPLSSLPPKKISPIFFLLETAHLSLMPFVCLECCLCVCVWHSWNFYEQECKQQIHTRLAEELGRCSASSVCYVIWYNGSEIETRCQGRAITIFHLPALQ